MTKRRRIYGWLIAGLLVAGLGLGAGGVLAQEAEAPPAMVEEMAPPAAVEEAPPAETEAPPPAISSGDTAWVLTSTALVLLMTAPGLAIFYGGMVRRKNVLATMMYSFIALCLVSVQWVLWGYSLAFGPDVGKIVGDLSYLGLKGVTGEVGPYSAVLPHQAFMAFQMVFAVITLALISGAFAERMKFSAFLLFGLLWTTFVYDPLCHWVWGGGWIGALGALDFAGGTVVHISSGVSALVCAIVLGKRIGYGSEPMPPHNLPLVLIGASLLWFGWFGFNAGSALTAGGQAATAFVATNTATAAAALAWMFAEWAYRGKPTMLGAASGAVAGLVAITPAAGFVGPIASILIGLVAGVLCYCAVLLRGKLGYDDALDVFGVHGIGGTWGAIATGLFANPAFGGKAGLFFGEPAQLGKQLIAVGATYALAIVGTFIILQIVNVIVGLRVSGEEERTGLDLSQHRESGYAI
jgi:Amt family ammonium transporter